MKVWQILYIGLVFTIRFRWVEVCIAHNVWCLNCPLIHRELSLPVLSARFLSGHVLYMPSCAGLWLFQQTFNVFMVLCNSVLNNWAHKAKKCGFTKSWSYVELRCGGNLQWSSLWLQISVEKDGGVRVMEVQTLGQRGDIPREQSPPSRGVGAEGFPWRRDRAEVRGGRGKTDSGPGKPHDPSRWLSAIPAARDCHQQNVEALQVRRNKSALQNPSSVLEHEFWSRLAAARSDSACHSAMSVVCLSMAGHHTPLPWFLGSSGNFEQLVFRIFFFLKNFWPQYFFHQKWAVGEARHDTMLPSILVCVSFWAKFSPTKAKRNSTTGEGSVFSVLPTEKGHIQNNSFLWNFLTKKFTSQPKTTSWWKQRCVGSKSSFLQDSAGRVTYRTSRDVVRGETLYVWYSDLLAHVLNVPVLTPDNIRGI